MAAAARLESIEFRSLFTDGPAAVDDAHTFSCALQSARVSLSGSARCFRCAADGSYNECFLYRSLDTKVDSCTQATNDQENDRIINKDCDRHRRQGPTTGLNGPHRRPERPEQSS